MKMDETMLLDLLGDGNYAYSENDIRFPYSSKKCILSGDGVFYDDPVLSYNENLFLAQSVQDDVFIKTPLPNEEVFNIVPDIKSVNNNDFAGEFFALNNIYFDNTSEMLNIDTLFSSPEPEKMAPPSPALSVIYHPSQSNSPASSLASASSGPVEKPTRKRRKDRDDDYIIDEEDNSDDEWSLFDDFFPDDGRGKKARKRKKSYLHSPVDKKKVQNRLSAYKYRQKKKAETKLNSKKLEQCRKKNKNLKTKVQLLEHEVEWLKNLATGLGLGRGTSVSKPLVVE